MCPMGRKRLILSSFCGSLTGHIELVNVLRQQTAIERQLTNCSYFNVLLFVMFNYFVHFVFVALTYK